MSAPKGYPSQTKLDRVSPEYATLEPIRENQQGLTVNAHVYVYSVGTDASEANSSASTINSTAHAARKGDVIHFTSGAFNNTEVKVYAVTANTIVLVQDMSASIGAGVTFEILRPKYPIVGSDGSISVTTTQGPIQFVRDGVDTEVNEDTVTPANNRGLPVTIVGAAGEVQITAGSLEVHLDSANDSVSAVVTSSVLPTGAATEATLASVDGKLNSLGQKAMAASVPVVIASDQSAIPITGTISTSEQAVVANGGALPAEVKVVAGYDGAAVKVLHTDVAGDLQVDILSSALPTGAATEATLASIDGNIVVADTGNVTVVSSVLPTGAATEATLASIDGNIVIADTGNVTISTALPAGNNNIGDVDVASLPNVNLNYLSVVDFLDTPLLIASSSNIPASASTPLTVVAALAADVKKLQILDTTGGWIGIYADPAGTPVLLAISGPGSDQTIEVAIPAATVIGVRNMQNAVINTGELAINFIG